METLRWSVGVDHFALLGVGRAVQSRREALLAKQTTAVTSVPVLSTGGLRGYYTTTRAELLARRLGRSRR